MTALFQRLTAIATGVPRGKIAIVERTRTISYDEFVHAAASFGARLSEVGVQPGARVCVILPNSSEFLVAAFGIWSRGAVVLPLDPQLTEMELLRCMRDSSVRALVSSRRNDCLVRALRLHGVSIEHTWLWSSAEGEWIHAHGAGVAGRCSSDRDSSSDGAALTQYSTGSTGRPKRVTRSHEQLLGEFVSVSTALAVTSDDTVLGVAPFFHSHGLMNAAMLTLLTGGTLHIAGSFFARDIARLIERERIRGFPAVPFMFQQLTDLPERHDLSSLRFALSAGAALPMDTARAFRRKYGVDIRPLYGSTETGVISIATAGAWDSVGHAIGGVTVSIVDERGQPSGTDTPGRVKIVSSLAASGYDGEGANSESYFSGDAFFPGDLGYVTAQGALRLCGRERGFINVGGNKVDPAEVETVLLECPGVTEAVVFGLPDGAAGEKIKAVLVATDASYEQLRTHCNQRLAQFKHPQVIERRQQLPKSPLGKVLRKYLMNEASDAKDQYAFAPRTGFSAAKVQAAYAKQSHDLASVPPFLRVLLCTDGTVTRSLEAYFWEPIDIDVLAHDCGTSERDHPAMQIAVGDSILLRRVVLRGRITNCTYAFAESVMCCEGLPADLMKKLVNERRGIGELVIEGRLETYRELGGIRRAKAAQWAAHLGVAADAPVSVRTYQIFHGGRARIQIEEIFPDAIFQRT